MELYFNDYYKDTINKIENTNINMVILGYAGSGKSTLLNYIVNRSAKSYIVVAPTGVAAVNVDGVTMHSLFKFPLSVILASGVKDLKGTSSEEALLNCDTIIIDEIGMVRADLLDGVDISLRKLTKNDSPFGGKQLVAFGDVSQLPPVVTDEESDIMDMMYNSPYFFDSNCAWNYKFSYKLLKHNYRQSDDKLFMEILNRMRTGKTTHEDIITINDNCYKSVDIDDKFIPYLCSTNRLANSINDKKLSEVDQPCFVYEAYIEGNFNPKSSPAPEILILKKGAKVMLLNNTSSWSNGTMGVISHLDSDTIFVETNDGEYEIGKSEWSTRSYSYGSGRVFTSIEGTMKQYPIKLAYANTIHKCQGKQFDNIILDLSSRLFTHGHLYVALSRCTTMNGVYLTRPIKKSDITVDKVIINFMKDVYKGNI